MSLVNPQPISADQPTDGEAHLLKELLSTPPTAKDEIMAEYDQLRKEILQNDTLALQIIQFIILLASALMGFAFTQQIKDDLLRSILFFLVETIAFLGLSQNADRLKSVYIVGSYIKNFIETETTKIRWEIRLSYFRTKPPKYGGLDLITHQRLVYTIIIVANFLLGIYYIYQSFSGQLLFFYAVAAIAFTATIIPLVLLSHQYTTLNKYHTDFYDEAWRKIKNAEKKNSKI